MSCRWQHAWLGCALALAAGCHLVVGSRGEEPEDKDESPVERQVCGSVSCGAGEVCCNASCGICSAPGEVCIQIACDPDNVGTHCADLSCSASQRCMEAPAGAQCVSPAEDPCTKLVCGPNQACEVVAGVARCWTHGADAGSGSDAGTKVLDAGASLDGGRVDAGGAGADAGWVDAGGADAAGSPDAATLPDASVPSDAAPPAQDASQPDASSHGDGGITPVSCATAMCPTGTYCSEATGVPLCLKLPSCDTVKCGVGKHCELDRVVCDQDPCPPVPVCVDDPKPTDPCAEKCKPGTHCELLEACTAGAADAVSRPYPCTQVPTCVIDTPPGGSCGGRDCGAGKFCCNASCGICISKRGACLDVACEPPNPTE